MGLFDFLSKKDKNINYNIQSNQEIPAFFNLEKIKNSQVEFQDMRQYDQSKQYIYPTASGGSSITVQTKKEMITEGTQDQSQEKPVNISPALLGTGGSTATGEGSVESSGSPILTYALIGAGVIAGIYVLKK